MGVYVWPHIASGGLALYGCICAATHILVVD